jgi:hypothetical protein
VGAECLGFGSGIFVCGRENGSLARLPTIPPQAGELYAARGCSPKTVRQMERDGLATRTVHPVIPPKVEYQLTELGHSLGATFCGVWISAEQHSDEIARARKAFGEGGPPGE